MRGSSTEEAATRGRDELRALYVRPGGPMRRADRWARKRRDPSEEKKKRETQTGETAAMR